MQSSGTLDTGVVRSAFDRAQAELLSHRSPQGYWSGELSSSALSTATACTALTVVEDATGASAHRTPVLNGLEWLARHQNADGGWGDTTRSLSNISTTTLCWAAFGAVRSAQPKFPQTI